MNADDLLRKVLETPNTVWFEADWAVLNEEIRAYLDAPKPVLYIKDRELVYIEGLKQAGLATEWHTNLGFVEEDGDVGLYTHPPTKTEPIGYVFQYSDGALGSDIYYTPEEAVEYTEGEGVGIPVYRDPPTKTEQKKPMTEEEVFNAYAPDTTAMFRIFKEGIRVAERHHGIGGGDE